MLTVMAAFGHIFVVAILCGSAVDARFSKEIRQNGLEAASPTLYNDTIDDIDELRAITVRPFRGRFNNTNSRAPCTCLNNYNCGCCAGMGFGSFRRQLCSNLTYHPDQFQLELGVMMNEEVLYQNMVTGRNPPPVCIPVPYTPAQMCIKLFNIFTKGRNIHACMDIETKTPERPLLLLHFDCMRMGQDGFVLLKPEENGGEIGSSEVGESGSEGGSSGAGGGGGGGGLFGTGLFSNRPKPTTEPTIATASTTEVPQIDTDIFDPITEIKLRP